MNDMQYCKAGRHFVAPEDYNAKYNICYICERMSRWSTISNTLSTSNILFEVLPNGHWRASWMRVGVNSSDLIATGRDKSFYTMPEVDLTTRAYETILRHLNAGYTPDDFILFNGTIRAVYLTLPIGSMTDQMNMVLRRRKSTDRVPTQLLGQSGRWTLWCPKIDFADPLLLKYDLADMMLYDEHMNQVKLLEGQLKYQPRAQEPIFRAHQIIWEHLNGRYFLYMTFQRQRMYIFDFVFS